MEIHHATTPEKQHDRHRGHAPPTRKPDGPDRERREGCRQRQTHPGPWQIRIVDGQCGPRDRYGPAQRDDDRDQPAERPGQEAAKRTHRLLPLFHSAERISASPFARAKRHASFRGRRDSRGTYTDRTSLVKPALVDFECCVAFSLRFKSLASMGMVRSTARHSGGPAASCLLGLPWCHVGLARRQPCRSFRIIVERVSFDQRCITQ
jgi:hypothetical protein